MATRQRPGLPSTATNPIDHRGALNALLDLVGRLTGNTRDKVRALKQLDELLAMPTALGGGATLGDTINKVNELILLATEMRENDRILRTKIDEVIARLQED